MKRISCRFPLFEYAAATLACAAILAGCASPGEPTDRKPSTPQAVTDLSAEQSGNDVVLTFVLPQETVDGRALEEIPSIEIFRDLESAGTAAPQQVPPANPTLALTIPSGMVGRYSKGGHVRVVDTLQASDFEGHPSATAVYMVRTRVSPKRDSQNSNAVTLRLFPAADSIDDLKAEVTPSAVVLTWTSPQNTLVGPVTSVGPYRIYRAEIEPPSASGTEAAKAQSALAKIGEADAPPFSDTQAIFGASYEYSVRSTVQYSDAAIESGDSNLVMIAPKDTFPPAAPQGLVAILVPAQGATPAHLELSWAISPETDIAGYNVYRSEEAGVQGTRQNTESLIAPAFRDMNVQPGRRYFYSVTAVDRSGNESPVSGVIAGGVPAEGQPTP